MNFKTRAIYLGAITIAVMTSSVKAAGNLYDSGGFESGTFSLGNLDDQDNGLWFEAGGGDAGTATVQNTSAFNSAQAVTVARTDSTANGGDKQYWPNLPMITPTTLNLVTVDWDMNVAKNSTAGVASGPFFGIESFDPNFNIIAAAGVDATTGKILYIDPATGGFTSTGGAGVTLGAWNHFSLVMDYQNDSASIAVNGAIQQTFNFTTTGVTQFSDADLATIATDAETTPQTGSAIFDNYAVSNVASVPEPTAIMAAGLAFLALRRRR